MNGGFQSGPGIILPAHPPSSIRPSIPIPSSSPFVQSNLPPLPGAGSLCSGKALRDWDLWGLFFFIVFLGLMLSWSPSVKKAKASLDSGLLLAFDLTQRTDSSEVFAVAFALLAAVAVILTLNVSSPRRSICVYKKVSIL
ncbi:hypothetical protein DY000_02013992 [Brassica cretica]|uniref:CASP-like protein n=1 Tax=Brassica cretica TaxID=69181 RepID=A0ABQ7DAR7_BRACR|nr:hypothetical protein DY000_02013992 [Brassica cretica]